MQTAITSERGNFKTVRPRDRIIDVVRWTGDNDDEVSAFLSRTDWRTTGTEVLVTTQRGWWLYLDDEDRVGALSPEALATRYEDVDTPAPGGCGGEGCGCG